MRFALAGMALLMNALDNFTTFACLRRPVVGFEVYEANPLARWGFDLFGLVPGLILEMALSGVAIWFLLQTQSFSRSTRMSLLAAMAVLPTWAVVNNLRVMHALGMGMQF
jgi:hypothetical protein